MKHSVTIRPPRFIVMCAVLSLVVAGCIELNVPRSEPSDVAVETITGTFLRIWNQQDGSAMTELFAEEAELLDISRGRTYRGHDELMARLRIMLYDAHQPQLTISAARIEGPLAVLEWKLTASFRGDEADELGISGLPFVLPGISVLHLHEGKVIRASEMYDLASVAHQFDVRMSFPEPALQLAASAKDVNQLGCSCR